MTSPNGASPQSKLCNPLIQSHSIISQLVPQEYWDNLGRGKIGTQTGVIFASPSEHSVQLALALGNEYSDHDCHRPRSTILELCLVLVQCKHCLEAHFVEVDTLTGWRLSNGHKLEKLLNRCSLPSKLQGWPSH